MASNQVVGARNENRSATKTFSQGVFLSRETLLSQCASENTAICFPALVIRLLVQKCKHFGSYPLEYPRCTCAFATLRCEKDLKVQSQTSLCARTGYVRCALSPYTAGGKTTPCTERCPRCDEKRWQKGKIHCAGRNDSRLASFFVKTSGKSTFAACVRVSTLALRQILES